jgi:flagellar assembly protein FliH
MATADKFTFGQDFGRRGAAPLGPSAGERAKADIEARARAAGLAEGIAAGRAQAQAELDHRMAAALESIGDRIATALAGLGRIEDIAADEAVAFGLRFAQSIVGVATQNFPLAALEVAARDVFGQVRQAPHCVVRLHEELLEQANELMGQVARRHGFEGRVIVMGDPDIAHGDFSIEWADGGVTRDGEAVRRLVVEAIERHSAAAREAR